jgi:hypothetical protein
LLIFSKINQIIFNVRIGYFERIFTDKIQEISIEVEITFDSFIAVFS